MSTYCKHDYNLFVLFCGLYFKYTFLSFRKNKFLFYNQLFIIYIDYMNLYPYNVNFFLYKIFFLYILGSIPSPVISGHIIDSLCTLWQLTCNVVSSCLLYDTIAFRYYLHGFTAALLFVMIILYSKLYFVLRKHSSYDTT